MVHLSQKSPHSRKISKEPGSFRLDVKSGDSRCEIPFGFSIVNRTGMPPKSVLFAAGGMGIMPWRDIDRLIAHPACLQFSDSGSLQGMRLYTVLDEPDPDDCVRMFMCLWRQGHDFFFACMTLLGGCYSLVSLRTIPFWYSLSVANTRRCSGEKRNYFCGWHV